MEVIQGLEGSALDSNEIHDRVKSGKVDKSEENGK